MVAVEVMVYSKNSDMGIIMTYRFHKSNTGLYRSTKYSGVFLPNQYAEEKTLGSVSMVLMLAFLCLAGVLLLAQTMSIYRKLREWCVIKVNVFQLLDFMTVVQITFAGLVFFQYWHLFMSQ